MKLSYVYENIKTAMNYIGSVNVFGAETKSEKQRNQTKINKAYEILHNLRNDIVIESQRKKEVKGEMKK